MTTSRDEKLTALGVNPERATRAEMIAALADRAGEANLDPQTLELLVLDTAQKLRAKYTHGETLLLAADALDRATEAEREAWRVRARQAQAAADAALPVVRAELEGAIAAQKQLTGEGDQPAASRQERLLARLLDVHAEADAERWVTSNTAADVLKRYQAAADDGPERSFARVVERRHASGVLALRETSDPLGTAQAFGAAIRTRQDARVRAEDLAALGTLDKLAADLGRSAAALAKPDRGAARVLAVAGKTGSQPRPARVTTPGRDDGRAV